MQAARTSGGWTNWILFFLAGIEETADAARAQTVALVGRREQFRHHTRGTAKTTELVDHPVLNPCTTIRETQEILRTPRPTARNVVAILGEAGILTEIVGKARDRRHRSDPIMRVLLAGVGRER